MSGIFGKRGIYIALTIILTLLLAAILIFVFSLPHLGGQGTGEALQPGQLPENFRPPEGAFQPPGAKEGSFPENFTPGASFEGGSPSLGKPSETDSGERRLLLLAAIVAAADALCLIMLVAVSRRQRASRAAEADGESESEAPTVHRKKSDFLPVLIILVASAALVFKLLPDSEKEELIKVEKELVEATVQRGSISRSLVNGGSISENTAKAVSLGGDIAIAEFLVDSGDYVQQGQNIALADKDSVILAIARLTELMAELDGEIDESRNDIIENAIYAPAAGRVKAIYAQTGEKVQQVVSEHSCLMRLSLDGLMAVDIAAPEGLYMGMGVTVRLEDGSLMEGLVEKVFEGEATVTLSDESAPYGQQAEILSPDGSLLGSGSLYIHKEVRISGISGTVQRLNVTENLEVGTDMALVVLGDIADRGRHDILTARRRQLEEELTKLFQVYNSGFITAPCNGRITALNEDVRVEALSSDKAAALVLLAGSTPEMKSYAVSVAELTEEGVLVTYTTAESSTQQLLDLSDTAIFLFADGSYRPCTQAEIKVGDALALICYCDESGSESLDHAVLYTAISDKESGTGSSQNGRPSAGGASGAMGGGGSQTASSGARGFSAAEAEKEDAYAFDKTVLAYIMPFDTADIVMTVDELDIASYRLGQPLQVELDALPGRSFEGTVTKIDPNGSNEDGGSTKYSVTVSIDREADMLSGMNASVRAWLETREDVLLLPLAAINEENGQVFVYTSYDAENDSLADPVSVTTGMSDGVNAEILSGLDEGQGYYYYSAGEIRYSFR